MKILIVDDNVAIQEIVRDILAEEGHNVRAARTIPEALAKAQDFAPDVIILDSWVGNEEGLHFLSRLKEEAPGLEPSVILLKSPAELVPTDNHLIKASINKPFKSSDIVAALRSVQEEVQKTEEPDDRRKAKKHRCGLFGRRKKDESKPPAENALQEHRISFGTSYVLFGRDSEMLYRFVGYFDLSKYNVMVITTDRSKVVKERFSYGDLEVITLSENGKGGSQGIRDLGTITSRTRAFLDGKEHPVVVFDKFGDVIAADGLNPSMMMINQLMSGKTRMCTIVVSVDPAILTDKDKGLFLHDMVEYKED